MERHPIRLLETSRHLKHLYHAYHSNISGGHILPAFVRLQGKAESILRDIFPLSIL